MGRTVFAEIELSKSRKMCSIIFIYFLDFLLISSNYFSFQLFIKKHYWKLTKLLSTTVLHTIYFLFLVNFTKLVLFSYVGWPFWTLKRAVKIKLDVENQVKLVFLFWKESSEVGYGIAHMMRLKVSLHTLSIKCWTSQIYRDFEYCEKQIPSLFSKWKCQYLLIFTTGNEK